MHVYALVVLQTGGGQMGNGMGPGGWGFGYGLVGLTVMLLFVGTIGYLLVQAFSGEGEPQADAARNVTAGYGDEDPALAELRERYARGEISDEEFERRAQRLRSDSDSLD